MLKKMGEQKIRGINFFLPAGIKIERKQNSHKPHVWPVNWSSAKSANCHFFARACTGRPFSQP